MQDQTKPPTAPAGAAASAGALAFLGQAPLVAGERPAAYDELLARVDGALNPADILEQIWMRDIVDLVWEVFRLRQLKASLMSSCARQAVSFELDDKPGEEADELALKWANHDEAARVRVAAELTSAGVTVEGVAAHAISLKIGELERIERMIAAAEGRRHIALRELDRHRATLAQQLRRALSEDADAQVVAREAAAQKPAS